MNLGHFSEESVDKVSNIASNVLNFSEGTKTFDFTRCQRPNGTFYGTKGKCKKGTEVGAKEVKKLDKEKLRGATYDQLKQLAQAGALDENTRSQIRDELKFRKEVDGLLRQRAEDGYGLVPDFDDDRDIEMVREVSDLYTNSFGRVLKNTYKGDRDQADIDFLWASGRGEGWGEDKLSDINSEREEQGKKEMEPNPERFQKAFRSEFVPEYKARFGKAPAAGSSNLEEGMPDFYEELGWNDRENPEDIAFGRV
jgi:hypothetical protein